MFCIQKEVGPGCSRKKSMPYFSGRDLRNMRPRWRSSGVLAISRKSSWSPSIAVR